MENPALPHVNAVRIDEHERRITENANMVRSIHALSGNVNALTEEMKEMRRDVAEIKGKGGKRYETIVSQLLTALAALFAGWIFSKFS